MVFKIMPETNFHPLAARFYRNTDAQFWLLQLVGWFGLSLISFFSLTVWYDQQTELSYVAHTLAHISCYMLLKRAAVVTALPHCMLLASSALC